MGEEKKENDTRAMLQEYIELEMVFGMYQRNAKNTWT